MPDYSAMKAEIALSVYSTMTDAQIAIALNALTVTSTVDVPISMLEGYLRQNGLMSSLTTYGENPPTGAPTMAVTAARELAGMVLSPHLSFVQMSDPTTQANITAMLTALVSAGEIDQSHETAVLAMASATQSTVQSWGFSYQLTDQDIMAARKWS